MVGFAVLAVHVVDHVINILERNICILKSKILKTNDYNKNNFYSFFIKF